jgi:hypothetical protein
LLTDEVIDCSGGDNGGIFIYGQTESSDNISTPNSFQQTIGGNYDAFITKFNALGQRQWGTYFGGTNDDWGVSINYVSSDTIYIQGNTQSLNNIATSTGHQKVFGGFQDAFLEKFIDCWSISTAQPIIGTDSVC